MISVKCPKYVIGYSFLDVSDCSNGTAKYIVTQQQQFNKKDISYVYIYGTTVIKKGIEVVSLYDVIVDGEKQGAYTIYEILEQLNTLGNIGKELLSIHIHHFFLGKMKNIEKIVSYCSPVPVYIYVHDYATVCSNVHLLIDDKKSCVTGMLAEGKCVECRFYHDKQKVVNPVKSFLERFQERISVICPSESCKKIWLMEYPEYAANVKVVPHTIIQNKDDKKERHESGIIRVAFVGQPRNHKGWEQWVNLVESIDQNDNELEFYVLSTEEVCHEQMIHKYTEVTNDNLKAMTNAIIENKIDICVLWSICSETYSYTCMESLEAGTYIVTCSDSGNVADVVRKNACGTVLENGEALNYFFSKKNREQLKQKLELHYASENACFKESNDNDYIVNNISYENTKTMFDKPKQNILLRLYDKFFLVLRNIKNA